MRWMKIGSVVVLVLLAILVVAITATVGIRPLVGPAARPLTDRRFEATPARLGRGEYLVTAVNGCLHCHSELDWESPGIAIKPGTEGGGRNWADEGLPWVTSSNITPDPEAGVGAWTDDMLARAIREGIGADGRALFPMMPYPRYKDMSDEDLASIVVYLRTLKPSPHRPGRTEMPFPVNRLINTVPQPLTGPVPEPDRSNPVSRGDYLVRMGVCGDCHTPTDSQGQPIPGLEFAGGAIFTGPYGQLASRNITSDPSGIPYYTEELFLEVMRTGQAKARKIHDAMPWIIYRNQTDDDLKAMFAYVQTLTPVSHRVDNSLPPTACPRCGYSHGAGDQNQAPAN
jgi:mono/diheme cytochrome c family protein